MSRTKQHQTVFLLTLLTGCALFFVASLIFPDSAYAQIPSEGILPQCNWYGDSAGNNKETYGLGAFILLAANIMKLIWGIAGSLALAMFVWGGFLWLTAAGEESRVKAGWDTFINATIGIAIILGSWVIINTLMLFLVSPGSFNTATLFSGGKNWVKIATENNTVCIKSAQLASGYVPAPPSGSGPAGAGVCCSESAAGVNAFVGVNKESCRDRVRTLVKYGLAATWRTQPAMAYYCPIGDSDVVCGEKWEEVKLAGNQHHWRGDKCPGGAQILKVVNKSDLCDDNNVCPFDLACDVNNSDGRTQCVDIEEDGLCCTELEGAVSGEKRYFLENISKKRKDCKSYSSSTSSVSRDGATWPISKKTKAFCPGGISSDCAEQNGGKSQVRINSLRCFIYK